VLEGVVVTGLVVDDAGFELVAGDERVGSRRLLSAGDVALLTVLADRYVRSVRAGGVGRFSRDWGRSCSAGWRAMADS